MNKPIDISEVILHTERLVLRPWKQSDLDDFYEYASVDGVGQMAGWLPHVSKDITQTIMDGFIANRKTFALQYQKKVIGSLGIEYYNEESYPQLMHLQGRSIGYVLSKDYWGQGLMPEAVAAVMDYLFNQEKLDFLIISHFEWNHQSKRVIEKCGFHFLRKTLHQTRYNTTENTWEYICMNPLK